MFCFAERSRLLKDTRQPSQGAWCHRFMTPGLSLGQLGGWEGSFTGCTWTLVISCSLPFSAHFCPSLPTPFQDLRGNLSFLGVASALKRLLLPENIVSSHSSSSHPRLFGEEPSKPMTCSPAVSTCF